jgi:hypothetical protein
VELAGRRSALLSGPAVSRLEQRTGTEPLKCRNMWFWPARSRSQGHVSQAPELDIGPRLLPRKETRGPVEPAYSARRPGHAYGCPLKQQQP